MTITVSMAYWRCQPYVEKAVRSILDQTYRDLRLVVVNDGDTPPVLPEDDRLVLLNLTENHGPYYCDAVVLAACDTEWFTIHAADDWSNLDRFERLMAHVNDVDEAIFGGSMQHKRRSVAVRPTDFAAAETSDILLNRGSIATGIYRTEGIRRTGAPHPEFRVAYDTMMVHLICRGLHWTEVDDGHGYQRLWRGDSLTKAPETGMHSPLRIEARRRRDRLWERVIGSPMEQWPDLLRPSRKVAASVARDADRLRGLMGRGAAA